MDTWYPGIEFKNGTLTHMPAICTVRHSFVTDNIKKDDVGAVYLSGDSSLCTLEHSYIEGRVQVSNEARLDMVNCHVLAVTDNEKTNKSGVVTFHEASAHVTGSLFSSQKRSSEAVASCWIPAIDYSDKTRGAVTNCLFWEQEMGISGVNSEVKVKGNTFYSSDVGVQVWRKSAEVRIVSNIFNDCHKADIIFEMGLSHWSN